VRWTEVAGVVDCEVPVKSGVVVVNAGIVEWFEATVVFGHEILVRADAVWTAVSAAVCLEISVTAAAQHCTEAAAGVVDSEFLVKAVAAWFEATRVVGHEVLVKGDIVDRPEGADKGGRETRVARCCR